MDLQYIWPETRAEGVLAEGPPAQAPKAWTLAVQLRKEADVKDAVQELVKVVQGDDLILSVELTAARRLVVRTADRSTMPVELWAKNAAKHTQVVLSYEAGAAANAPGKLTAMVDGQQTQNPITPTITVAANKELTFTHDKRSGKRNPLMGVAFVLRKWSKQEAERLYEIPKDRDPKGFVGTEWKDLQKRFRRAMIIKELTTPRKVLDWNQPDNQPGSGAVQMDVVTLEEDDIFGPKLQPAKIGRQPPDPTKKPWVFPDVQPGVYEELRKAKFVGIHKKKGGAQGPKLTKTKWLMTNDADKGFGQDGTTILWRDDKFRLVDHQELLDRDRRLKEQKTNCKKKPGDPGAHWVCLEERDGVERRRIIVATMHLRSTKDVEGETQRSLQVAMITQQLGDFQLEMAKESAKGEEPPIFIGCDLNAGIEWNKLHTLAEVANNPRQPLTGIEVYPPLAYAALTLHREVYRKLVNKEPKLTTLFKQNLALEFDRSFNFSPQSERDPTITTDEEEKEFAGFSMKFASAYYRHKVAVAEAEEKTLTIEDIRKIQDDGKALKQVKLYEPAWTTSKLRSEEGEVKESTHTIDYIFCQPDKHAKVHQVLRMTSIKLIPNVHLPCHKYPSDHVALAAMFEVGGETENFTADHLSPSYPLLYHNNTNTSEDSASEYEDEARRSAFATFAVNWRAGDEKTNEETITQDLYDRKMERTPAVQAEAGAMRFTMMQFNMLAQGLSGHKPTGYDDWWMKVDYAMEPPKKAKDKGPKSKAGWWEGALHEGGSTWEELASTTDSSLYPSGKLGRVLRKRDKLMAENRHLRAQLARIAHHVAVM